MVYCSPGSLPMLCGLLVGIALLRETVGNVFLTSPRGSNNKLTDDTNAAQNPNRLFKSDNNPNGGHNVGDNCIPSCRTGPDGGNYTVAFQPPNPLPLNGAMQGQMYFLQGSELYIEWSTLHGCGSPATSVDCQIVLQYMCSSWSYDLDSVRDGLDGFPGTPAPANRRRSAGNDGATPVTPETAAALDRGRHESFSSYNQCAARMPNMGLFTGGAQSQPGIGAQATRQNPTGERFGMECQEERDYYPYWHPSEWKDIAVFSSRADKDCGMYRSQSQNVVGKGFCDGGGVPVSANNANDCAAIGTWVKGQSWGIDPPVCRALVPMEDNIQGTNSAGKYQSYMWKIPTWTLPVANAAGDMEDQCVLRVRYNVSDPYNPPGQTDYDYFNLVAADLNPDGPYGGDNPSDDWTGLGVPLQLQMEKRHFARTFQDRSHVFKVRPRPATLPEDVRIINYNVRGRRGTIGQIYPSPGYGFVPPDLEVSQGDFLHFQWTGADSNPYENSGTGKTGTDRSNLVQMQSATSFTPLPVNKHTLFFDGGSPSTAPPGLVPPKQTCHGYFFAPCTRGSTEGMLLATKMAYLQQEFLPDPAAPTTPACKPLQALGDPAAAEENAGNCAVLNAAPAYFDAGLVEMTMTGTHHVASTRNNDFSIVSHKGTIMVARRSIYWWVWVLLVVGVIFVIFCAFECSRACYAYLNPTSDLFSRKRRPMLLKAPVLRWMVQKKEEERRHFKRELQDAWRKHCAGKGEAPGTLKKAKTLANGSKDGQPPGVAGVVKLPVAPVGAMAKGKGKGKGLPDAPIEKRIDPTDGCAYTLAEVRQHYANMYTPKEVDEYWELYMTQQGGGGTTNSASSGENADLALPPAWLQLQQKKKQSRCGCLVNLTCCPTFHNWFREENIFVWIFLATQAFCIFIGFMNNYKGGFSLWFACAKIGGYMLDFNLACILIPTLRSVHSCVRPVRALDTLFNDEPIHFHIQCAFGVALGSLVHITGHAVHIIQIVQAPEFEQPQTPLQKLSGMSVSALLFNPANRYAGFTGVILSYLFSAMFATALQNVRRRTFNFKKCPATLQELKGWMLLTFALTIFAPFWLPRWLYRVMCVQRCKGRWTPESGKLGGFTVFWEIHKCWAPCFAILMVHGPNCWIWFMWPLTMLLCDRLVKWERRKVTSYLKTATYLKGKVLRLEFIPPNGFIYQAGTYILLNCDMVGPEEWHPFTLTSAPEENVVSVHIRCPDELDWCSALRRKLVETPAIDISDGAAKDKIGKCSIKVHYAPYHTSNIFGEEEIGDDCRMSRPYKIEVIDKDSITPYTVDIEERTNADHRVIAGLADEELDMEAQIKKRLRQQESQLTLEDMIKPQKPSDVVTMAVDGPHGAPAELVWRHEHVVLVGAGIGVTPFAAILKSITLRIPTKSELAAGPLIGAAPTSRGSILKRANSNLNKGIGTIGKAVPKTGGTELGKEPPSAVNGDSKDDKKKDDKKKDGEPGQWSPCKAVHFYWLCRNQEEFDWFFGLLQNAVSQASKDRIEINLFKTGETELTNIKSVGETGVFREFFGRPNWNRIFPKLAEKYPGESVGVFYCGVAAGRADLGAACIKATNTNDHGTRFTLHAENF